MSSPFLKQAQREVAKWEGELQKIPAFRHWLAAKSVVDAYKEDEAPLPAQPITTLPTPKTADVLVKAAGDYLREKGRRVNSTVMAAELAARGVHIPGKNPASTLSAYLSAAKEINNKRGEGYGLVEWSLPNGSNGTPNDEAPGGSNLSGASLLNGRSHDSP